MKTESMNIKIKQKSICFFSWFLLSSLISGCSGQLKSLLTTGEKSNSNSSSNQNARVVDLTNANYVKFDDAFQKLKFDSQQRASALMVSNAQKKAANLQRASGMFTVTECYVPKQAASSVCDPEYYKVQFKNDNVQKSLMFYVFPNEKNFAANADLGADFFENNGAHPTYQGTDYINTSFKVKAIPLSSSSILAEVNSIKNAIRDQINDQISGLPATNLLIDVIYYSSNTLFLTDFNRGYRVWVRTKCSQCSLNQGATKEIVFDTKWEGNSGEKTIPVALKIETDPAIPVAPLPLHAFGTVPKEYEVTEVPSYVTKSVSIQSLISQDELDNYNNSNGTNLSLSDIRFAPSAAGQPVLTVSPSVYTNKFLSSGSVDPTPDININQFYMNSNDMVVNVVARLEASNGPGQAKSTFQLPIAFRFFKPISQTFLTELEVEKVKDIIASGSPTSVTNIIFSNAIHYSGACLPHSFKALSEGQTHGLAVGIPLDLRCTKPDDSVESYANNPGFFSFITNAQNPLTIGSQNVSLSMNTKLASDSCSKIEFDLLVTSQDAQLCPGDTYYTQYAVTTKFIMTLEPFTVVDPTPIFISDVEHSISSVPQLTSHSTVTNRYRRVSLHNTIINALANDYGVVNPQILSVDNIVQSEIETEGVVSNINEKFLLTTSKFQTNNSPTKCTNTEKAPCLILDWQAQIIKLDDSDLYNWLSNGDAISLNLYGTANRNSNAQSYGAVLNSTGVENQFGSVPSEALGDLIVEITLTNGDKYQVNITSQTLKVSK
jgi:hypothetical protein